jgi:hypothetical protein
LNTHPILTKRGQDLAVAFLANQRVEEYDRAIHLRIDVDRGDRDQRQAFVIDAGEFLRDYLAQRLAQASGARVPMGG